MRLEEGRAALLGTVQPWLPFADSDGKELPGEASSQATGVLGAPLAGGSLGREEEGQPAHSQSSDGNKAEKHLQTHAPSV